MSISGEAHRQNDTAVQPGTAVTAGVASATIVAANPSRIEVFIGNDHASNVLYLRLDDSAAVANQGIRLAAGQSVVITSYTGEIRGIASGASTNVVVCEV